MAAQDNNKKLIAVVGATGSQGGAVVDALLTASDEFAIRAITRNPDSEKSKALEAKGCEVVKADADDVASMVSALEGCYGAFLVTNFWADMSMSHEIETTAKLQEACAQAKVEHVVLSTLEDTRPMIQAADNADTWKVLDQESGSYVPHFDGKGEAGKKFLESEVPVTLLFTIFYYDNFINFGMGPQKHGEDQPYAITFPTGDAPFGMNSLRDIGCNVLSIFKDPSTINTSVGVVSEFATGKEIADAFAKVIGEPVVFNAVPVDVYAGFGFPGAADLANMFRFYAEFPAAHRTVEGNKERLGRKTDSLVEWIEANKAAFMPSK
eukprot:CAMPEP_0116132684 /NCGR_PEP_ID=MMETSP0329-20121206/9686_1 /TAXON_ID=697910 /ORGANISM="Pseudo-nitzschia arenysensis, Strain B593" /LENGTH=322 /DNA_ID=CAMNT_0003627229 /DNA_START=69 /DNA_END=1037 /DNA_ORIENTATION=+